MILLPLIWTFYEYWIESGKWFFENNIYQMSRLRNNKKSKLDANHIKTNQLGKAKVNESINFLPQEQNLEYHVFLSSRNLTWNKILLTEEIRVCDLFVSLSKGDDISLGEILGEFPTEGQL